MLGNAVAGGDIYIRRGAQVVQSMLDCIHPVEVINLVLGLAEDFRSSQSFQVVL